MKKLRLNKLFHWLYCFLMVLPIVNWASQYVLNFATGTSVTETLQDAFYLSGLADSVFIHIKGVYDYLFNYVIGLVNTPSIITVSESLTYWTVVSLGYLIFDVLMYPINLFHRWIDEGGF